MGLYRVLLGIDRAARDTGRRLVMTVRGRDYLDAGLQAEKLADQDLDDPEVEYTHAMRITRLAPAAEALALAA